MPDEGDEILAEPHQQPQPGHAVIGIDWRISLTLLFMVFVSSVGLIVWAVTSANHAADALVQLADLKVQIATGTQPVPTIAVHVDNLEKWVNHADAVTEAQDKRLAALEQQAALLNAQIGSITAASSVHRGPRR